ncbi:WD repeat-containing protein 20 isoform X1 [Corythoichthys intestinalis]|uniref:WD repeat-containing protein 20 isoform X1 n=1 Tax=Corythoichthys intestinalis TaxID=161448 RepID=UPI0025A67056|nr:WD repeat-containing protein 20 isoform X1 [Corythoichthys intestinalis]XP_061806483.1 WD repeat-containing protein 20-like isoform X2 [Nerophis lumbriciformis]
MAAEGGGKETNEIKTQFTTREGVYKLLTHSEYSRPNRVPFNSQGSNPVRVSFVNVNDQSGNGDRICFNVGRELYFYIYKGVRKAADLSKPIDKRMYKGTQPTCHDFNPLTATAESVSLLVGFSAGQVQLTDPIKKETSKLFNEERLIDKSRVTCVRWVPGSESLFLVAHSSGTMYLYNVENTCGTAVPHYQLLKQGENYAVHTCKSKSGRNPLLRWTVGDGALNEFAFSPDGKFLACASQDGYLRVFGFDAAELHGTMKSYFGGLLCVCWSPDGRYIVAGGEDDLVTVWSFSDCRVIARGHGHKSWVSVVAFDHCTTSVEDSGGAGEPTAEFSGSDEDFYDHIHFSAGRDRANSAHSRLSKRNSTDSRPVSVTYRFGSVGQDTQLCLWDLTEDILFPHLPLSRTRTHTNVMNASSPTATAMSTIFPSGTNGKDNVSNSSTGGNTPNSLPGTLPRSNSLPQSSNPAGGGGGSTPNSHTGSSSSGSTGAAPVPSKGGGGSIIDSALIAAGVGKFATLSLHETRKDRPEKEHKRMHSVGHIGSKSGDKLSQLGGSRTSANKGDMAKTLGTTLCPRMEEVPLLEPLVCKKIAHERLTVLIFLEDCLVTACQEGFVCTWARPGKVGLLSSQNNPANSPSGTVV